MREKPSSFASSCEMNVEFCFTTPLICGISTTLPFCRYTSLGNGTAMKAGTGAELVVRSNRATTPWGAGVDEPDDDEPQATEKHSANGRRRRERLTCMAPM